MIFDDGLPPNLQRVVVVGTSCAGKTTFAFDLGKVIGSKVIDLDPLHWGPNWTPKPREEFRQLVTQEASGERWIISGNYSPVRDILWSRATAIIWLNYNFPTVFWRALKRTVRRAITREELWHGNRESFRLSFLSRDSILVWVLTTHGRRRKEFQEIRDSQAFPNLQWTEFRRPREAILFLGQELPRHVGRKQ